MARALLDALASRLKSNFKIQIPLLHIVCVMFFCLYWLFVIEMEYFRFRLSK